MNLVMPTCIKNLSRYCSIVKKIDSTGDPLERSLLKADLDREISNDTCSELSGMKVTNIVYKLLEFGGVK